ncbi:hypothetical protein [Amycolatopsis sp. GA6-003]|uniref:hypothetical protein n=1 Tax=Amycolatopsis sp. GA6-003 TaxID=2652444 RepID=UPI003916EC30
MGWFGRKSRADGGYQDNAALSGFGGYEPSDAPKSPSAGSGKTDPAPGPSEPAPQPPRRSSAQRKVNLRLVKAVPLVLLIGAFGYNVLAGKSHHPASTDHAPHTYQPEPRVVVPPVVPGWQSVAGKDGSYAYDVPPSWEPAPTTLHGWDPAPGSPGLTLATSAFLGKHSCKEDAVGQIGGAGFTTEKTADAAEAARKAVTDLAISAYTGEGAPPAKVTPGAPEKNDSGEGMLVLAEVTPSNAPCQPKSVLAGALALKAGDKSAVLVAYSEQGRPGSASRDDLVRILRSYRAVPASDRSTTTPPPATR